MLVNLGVHIQALEQVTEGTPPSGLVLFGLWKETIRRDTRVASRRSRQGTAPYKHWRDFRDLGEVSEAWREAFRVQT